MSSSPVGLQATLQHSYRCGESTSGKSRANKGRLARNSSQRSCLRMERMSRPAATLPPSRRGAHSPKRICLISSAVPTVPLQTQAWVDWEGDESFGREQLRLEVGRFRHNHAGKSGRLTPPYRLPNGLQQQMETQDTVVRASTVCHHTMDMTCCVTS